MNKMKINGRVVYIGSRTFLKIDGDAVVLSDESKINPKDWTVINKNMDDPILFDAPPAGYKEPVVSTPVDMEYKSNTLKIEGVDREIEIIPHDSSTTLVKACRGITSKLYRSKVVVKELAFDGEVEVKVDTRGFLFKLWTLFESVSEIIRSTKTYDDKLTVYVPFGSTVSTHGSGEITASGLESLTVGNDSDLSLKTTDVNEVIVNADDITLDIMSAKTVTITTGYDVTGKIVGLSDELTCNVGGEFNVSLESMEGHITIKSNNDVDLVVDKTKSIDIQSDGDVTLKVETSEYICIKSYGETSLIFNSVDGDVWIEAGDEVLVRGSKVLNLSSYTSCDTRITLQILYGDIDITSDELNLLINNGEIGSVKVDADGDTDIEIKTHVNDLDVKVDGDGKVLVESISTQKIKITGDSDINIG